MVNGTLPYPEKYDEVWDSQDAMEFLEVIDTNLCFYGNDGRPIVYYQNKKVITYTLEVEIKLEKYVKALVNVGSVGQPRDRNPKSCFVIYDTDQQMVWIKRVAYDIQSTPR